MEKIYERINWEDHPSTKTPINANNLNKMDEAIDKLDDRVTELNGNLEQSTEGRFVLPNGLKICWGMTTPTYVSAYACQELVRFPIEFTNAPKIIAAKILKEEGYSNGTVDLSVQCSARNVGTVNFVAVMQSVSGKFTSDITIQDYVDDIWKLEKVEVTPLD